MVVDPEPVRDSLPKYDFNSMNRKWSRFNCSENAEAYYKEELGVPGIFAGIITTAAFDLTLTITKNDVTTLRESTFKTSSQVFPLDQTTLIETKFGDFTYKWHQSGDNYLKVEKVKLEENIRETVVYTVVNDFLKITQTHGQKSAYFYLQPSE